MSVTPAAVEEFFNVSDATIIPIWRGIKLAAYYIIKDYMVDSKANTSPEHSFSTKSPEISYGSGTTFSDAIRGKKVDEVLEVFEELMATLQVINPRLYESVMRKL